MAPYEVSQVLAQIARMSRDIVVAAGARGRKGPRPLETQRLRPTCPRSSETCHIWREITSIRWCMRMYHWLWMGGYSVRYIHLHVRWTAPFKMTAALKWDEFIDATIIASGFATKATIFGLSPKPVQWTSTRCFAVMGSEVTSISNAFTDPSNLRYNGMFIAGRKYTCVKADNSLIIGRTVEGGCLAARCKKSVLIVLFDDPYQSNCANLTNKLAICLRDYGF